VRELVGINNFLNTNPYAQLIQMPATKAHHFFTDKEGNKVNPYQKPLSLYNLLLRLFVQPGAVVVDATTGTGALELAAMERTSPSKLRIVAFEKNTYQFDAASYNLKKAADFTSDNNDESLYTLDLNAERYHPKKKASS
jgi:DNA modification methylase